MPLARIVDLCDARTLTNDDRKHLNTDVECDDPAEIRYIGLSPDRPDVFRRFEAREIDAARAWRAQENARIREQIFVPSDRDYFGATAPDANGCSSRGLKEIPEIAGLYPAVRADVDGDGRIDRVVHYGVGWREIGNDQYHWRVELGTGTIIDDDTNGRLIGYVNGIYGVTDLDGNVRSEIWIEPSTNKPGAVGLLVFEDCALREVDDESGSLLIHTYGGMTQAAAAVSCTEDRIIRAHWTTHRDSPWGPGSSDVEESWWYEILELRGHNVVEVDGASGADLDDRPSSISWEPGFHCL